MYSASSSSHVGLYTSQSESRLPKLSLPTFSRDPLSWQTFWDSFQEAVHADLNPTLSGAQKFNYLKGQLRRDAARAVTGFPLTDCYYKHSTEILQERFGQTHTIAKAHMQALVDLPSLDSTFTDLRSFYDLPYQLGVCHHHLDKVQKSREIWTLVYTYRSRKDASRS